MSQQTYLLPAGWGASSLPVEGWQNSAVAVSIFAAGWLMGSRTELDGGGADSPRCR
ncbi:MAG: hypothetical protein KME26_23620 [Oscillatoria princeps RMCB-10]|nr:hypothetical protein [Oscillatoria princeps RMCB-10]